MTKPIWLSIEDCLAIHEMVLAQYGGLAGVGDAGTLESALMRPQQRFAYGSIAIADLAASYAAGIIQNHPFLDGNKRTGFLTAATFMELNRLKFTASEESVVIQTVALAAGQLKESQYAAWLQDNSRAQR